VLAKAEEPTGICSDNRKQFLLLLRATVMGLPLTTASTGMLVQCAPRDQWIGWSSEQRAQGLQRIVNNSRFLIMPWVRVSCLGSHILSQIARRINADWQARYRHPIDLLETFVQQDRFRGTCYQAANWIHVGQTTGRTRQNKHLRDNQVHAPIKDIYLYPIHADARGQLCR
jgi:hypothetical protein